MPELTQLIERRAGIHTHVHLTWGPEHWSTCPHAPPWGVLTQPGESQLPPVRLPWTCAPPPTTPLSLCLSFSSSLLFGAAYVCRAPAYLDPVDMLSGTPTPGSPRVPQQRALRLKQVDEGSVLLPGLCTWTLAPV